MSGKLETILKIKVDKKEQSKAERYVKAGNLLFANQRGDSIEALFKDAKNSNVRTVINLADKNETTCNCQARNGTCVHIIALALHYLKFFCNKEKHSRKKSPSYSGLKLESLDNLSKVLRAKYEAEVKLTILKNAPHTPSKWEKCDLSVKLTYLNKEYNGNIGNLRQLNFGKGIGCGVKISQFHPQDRQIIRFLAINAEADGKAISLTAENVAEFYHCLTGFNRCFYEGVPIFVHRDTAEPVLLYRELKNEIGLKPALITDVGTVTLKDAKMITGRAGCWIGMALDYWWIPGNIDLLWLRSFLRTGTLRCEKEKAWEIMEKTSESAVRVINSSAPDAPHRKKCIPLYSADYTEDGVFEIQLSYAYGDAILPIGGSGISSSKSSTWQRDRKFEKKLENELLALGFLPGESSGNNVYRLDSQEAAGIFLDEILPQWLEEDRNLYLSGHLANLISEKTGVKNLAFNCLDVTENDRYFDISYSIATPGMGKSIAWRKLHNELKKNSHFVYDKGDVVGKISPALAKFVSVTADFVQPVKDQAFILRIPRSSALYWAEAYQELTGVIPNLLAELHRNLPKNDTEFFKPANKTSILEKTDVAEEEQTDSKELYISSEKQAKLETKYKLAGDLRVYQREGVKWIRTMLKNRLNVILADEMGLGKTIQALALILDQMNLNPEMNNHPSLVLCPSSLVDNWQMEAAKFAPQLKTLIIRGSRRETIMSQIIDSDLVIASYPIAARESDRLKEYKFRFLILDEAQHIKNPSTVNAKTCKSLNAFNKIVLTGTPLENSPDELWSIFDFLQPKMLGSMSVFKNRYAGISNDEEIQGDLAARTAPFILRRKKDEVEPDLPKKIVQTIYCEMDGDQRKIYDDFREQGLEAYDSLVKTGKNSRFDLLTNLLRLRQICCHPLLLPGDNPKHDILSAKTELLQELLLESLDSGHKVLLFSQFTSFLAIIRKWLFEEGINFEYLDGSTKDRMERVKNFNNSPDIPLFLLSLKAGGVGLNLTAADRVIIYDPWWNPAVEAQATDRTHRIGQTKSVYSMKLVVKNSIEEKILSLQQKKQRIFANLVESQSTSLKQLSDDDLEFLLT